MNRINNVKPTSIRRLIATHTLDSAYSAMVHIVLQITPIWFALHLTADFRMRHSVKAVLVKIS